MAEISFLPSKMTGSRKDDKFGVNDGNRRTLERNSTPSFLSTSQNKLMGSEVGLSQ